MGQLRRKLFALSFGRAGGVRAAEALVVSGIRIVFVYPLSSYNSFRDLFSVLNLVLIEFTYLMRSN